MLQKIKDLMQIKELIDQISNKIKEHNEIVNSAKKDIELLKGEIASLKSSHEELVKDLTNSIGTIDDIKEGLKKELYDFNLIKSHLQNKILEKFEKELQNELKLNLEKLKADSKNYEDAKKELALLVEKTGRLGEEIDKFVEISKNIKKEDFMLAKFCNKVWEMDKEKLELMRKIDTLERLISKIRRTPR